MSSAKSGDARAKPTKAEQRSERAAARLEAIERNASSIPPAAMHDVFDVALPPVGRSFGSVPPPVPRGERRKSARPASHKPAPHPPRPTKPPPPPGLAAPVAAAGDDGVELAANEYEFANDSFGIPSLLPPRTDAPLELRAELPAERVDEPRPARIPYRAIALTSASLMVALIVVGLARPKDDARARTTAAVVPQNPIVAARTETPLPLGSVVPVTAAEDAPRASASDPVAAAPAPAAGALEGEPALSEGMRASTSPAAGIAGDSAPTSRRVPRADAGVAAGFDAAAASSSITAAFARASSCLKDGEPKKSATILLTYAPSGRVTTAVLQGPYSGTAVGGCIASTLRTARVPPFSGDYVTVKRTSVLK